MIPRIPSTEFQFQPFEDQDVIQAFNWFRSFISDKEWLERKTKIEKDISIVFVTHPSSIDIRNGTLIAIQEDKIGWYLYLIYVRINEPYKYDHYQGARVLPIFKRIGINLDLVKNIDGINKKIKTLLRKRTKEADAILFEILTALLWVRNGWQVKILDEIKTGKSPDLEVCKDGEIWQIECKRQMKTSVYACKETSKRQILISHISELLVQYNIFLNIKFHVELESLPDTYLRDILKNIIPKANSGTIISDDKLKIDLSFVDIQAIQKHLENNYIKNHSPQLIELIANKPIDNTSFTYGIKGNYIYVGEGETNNLFISEIYNAFGVQCYCDAEESIKAKARDVKIQIHSAMKQFNSNSNGIIHIGMETFDGPQVECERAKKIMNTLGQINVIKTSSNLRWIYFHYFQSYSRSYEDWFVDETVDSASAYVNPISPIQNTFLILPEDLDTINGSHWNRELP